MISKHVVIQIGIVLLIGLLNLLLHYISIVYESIDNVLFGRHTMITGLIIVPFLFGFILYIFLRKRLIYPAILIAAGPLLINVLTFLYVQYLYEGPKDNIGIFPAIIMFSIESIFIFFGALFVSAVLRKNLKGMAC
jgi:hypothetical protein